MTELTNISPFAGFLPATIIPDNGLSDDRLEALASRDLDNAHIRCERTEQGPLRMYAPVPEAIWLMIQSLRRELTQWLGKTNTAGQVVARRRFFLGDFSMMCPDIAYIAPDGDGKRVDIGYGRLLNLCPSFVVEFCTHPRELRWLKDKMLRWMASGAELGWLVVPQEQCVYTYSPSAEAVIMKGQFAVGRGRWEELTVFLPELWSFDQYKRSY
jgi:hypothetical protein